MTHLLVDTLWVWCGRKLVVRGRITVTHHSSTAAAALATCAATYPVQAGESRLPCTVRLGARLPCRRLSAGCRFRTEIPAVRRAACLLCATSEQHFRRAILHGCRSACMERAAVQSTWCWAIADYFQCPLEDILFSTAFEATALLWHLWFLCAAYKCTYLLTYLHYAAV